MSAERKVPIVPSICLVRLALCAFRLKWLPLALVFLIAASGCALLRRELTPNEFAERLQYIHDRALEELVDIALARGYKATNGEGQTRQVLELNKSQPGTIHRQFFEVQPCDTGLSDVFFLENEGSVEQTDFNRIPKSLRRDINTFLEELPEHRSGNYKPLLVQQEKLARKMIVYETSDGGRDIEFTRKVVFLEKSNLYGLFHIPDGPFIFFGKESRQLFRKDFLEADQRYKQLLHEFLGAFRIRSTL